MARGYANGVAISGGQWQKLALGHAMMREQPLLLILDEPTFRVGRADRTRAVRAVRAGGLYAELYGLQAQAYR